MYMLVLFMKMKDIQDILIHQQVHIFVEQIQDVMTLSVIIMKKRRHNIMQLINILD